MLHEKLKKFSIILASQSPRRQFLLQELGLNFEIKTKNISEIYPDSLREGEIVKYLAELKAAAFESEMLDNTLLITADTIVWLEGEVLEKPKNFQNAFEMLKKLSGKKHIVYTGVCLKTLRKQHTFIVDSNVFFKNLSDEEIQYYLENFQPYDKAGAYGVQEWLGYVAITRIEGSYFNVMGLPVQRLYEELLNFTKNE